VTNFLVTTGGDTVLPTDANGQPVADARIRVRQDGQYDFVTEQGQPHPAAANLQLGVVDIVDSTQMQKYGETYFNGGEVAAQSTGVLQQGKLEQSNVDLAQSMVSMISVSRMYEANQRMIRTLDSTLEKATSVGRLG
jgi:flagellar basal-body rod protein FlgG